jgi:hypothetical protein
LETAEPAQIWWEMSEPGLDLHEWATRWEQLEEAARESPADAAGELDRLARELLEERGLDGQDDEALRTYVAAHDLLRRYERGEGSAGDLAEAINGFRAVYELVAAELGDVA